MTTTIPTTTYAISVGVANIHRHPDPTSELVTQALLNVPAIADQTEGEWTHVTLPDYSGWIRTSQLEEPIRTGFCKVGDRCATPLQLLAIITTTHTPLYTYAEEDEMLGIVYLSTALPLLDVTHTDRIQVALPGEQMAWLTRGACDIRQATLPYFRTTIDNIIHYARSFLGQPYLWGGTT